MSRYAQDSQGNLEMIAGNANYAVIAPKEISPATAPHVEGSQIIYGNALYKVIDDIAIGDTLTVGTNITAAPDITTQLANRGYRIVDTQNKTTIGQTMSALEAAFNNLTMAEKARSAILVNHFILRCARDNSFAFGCTNPSSSNVQNVIAGPGLYASSVINSSGVSSYNDYSNNTVIGAASLIVFD